MDSMDKVGPRSACPDSNIVSTMGLSFDYQNHYNDGGGGDDKIMMIFKLNSNETGFQDAPCFQSFNSEREFKLLLKDKTRDLTFRGAQHLDRCGQLLQEFQTSRLPPKCYTGSIKGRANNIC